MICPRKHSQDVKERGGKTRSVLLLLHPMHCISLNSIQGPPGRKLNLRYGTIGKDTHHGTKEVVFPACQISLLTKSHFILYYNTFLIDLQLSLIHLNSHSFLHHLHNLVQRDLFIQMVPSSNPTSTNYKLHD